MICELDLEAKSINLELGPDIMHRMMPNLCETTRTKSRE